MAKLKGDLHGIQKGGCGTVGCRGKKCNGRGSVLGYTKPSLKSFSDYQKLKNIAKSGKYEQAFITKQYEDGKQDLIVEVRQDNGKTKLESFTKVKPIPAELKLKVLTNDSPVEGSRSLLKDGPTEIVRQVNESAGHSSKNVDPEFEKQVLRYSNLTDPQKWAIYEDALVYSQKGDWAGIRDCLLSIFPGLFAYRTNIEGAVEKLKNIELQDEASKRITKVAFEFMDGKRVA